MSKPNRREFLKNSAPLIAAPLILPALARDIWAGPAPHSFDPASSNVLDVTQAEWRYCDKCAALFFNGANTKGRCPAGGGHEAQGYNFMLPYGNLPEIPNAQINWRFCDKCYAMFWDGNPSKGSCPAGGGHHALGFLFRLPHDINIDANNQGAWRFCQKCRAMFYDGNPNKGRCPAGGGHAAQGYLFVLPHGGSPDIHLRSELHTDGWAPIGGWVDIVMRQNGDYVFSGHVHNSGALNIRYSLAAVVTTPSGQSFGFGINGHRVDGTETISGRNRDHDWNQAKNDLRIAKNWNSVRQGTLSWRLVASATITSTIEKFIENMAKEAFTKLAQTMNATPGGQLARFYMNLILTL